MKMMLTAEKKSKWRSDQYSGNLQNKLEKKFQGFNGIKTLGLWVSAAVLY